mgnify:CR=1 FL=1
MIVTKVQSEVFIFAEKELTIEYEMSGQVVKEVGASGCLITKKEDIFFGSRVIV